MEQQSLVSTEPIEQFVNRIGADTVFGAPITEHDVTLIPVAQVEFGFGYGGGYGQVSGGTEQAEGQEQDGEESEPTDEDSTGEGGTGEGGGGGGGGGGRATPRGYIHVSPEGVTYKPIEDEVRIPLFGIILAAWTVFWVTATVRVIAKSIAQVRQMKQ
ncbi:MAG: spore germination protein GerW family protein [Chloroflexota bacterium]